MFRHLVFFNQKQGTKRSHLYMNSSTQSSSSVAHCTVSGWAVPLVQRGTGQWESTPQQHAMHASGTDNNNTHNNNRTERRNLRFFTLSSQRRELSPTHTLKWPGRNHVQIMCNTSSTYHVQHVIRATWYEGTAQLLSLTEFKSHLF